MTKKILIGGVTSGLLLLGLSYVMLYVAINFLPALAEEFYNPVFWPGNERAILFFLHPFILSFALAWFFYHYRSVFNYSDWRQGLELGVTYAIIATLPSMWIIFSAINVSLAMVISWFAYGLIQATVAGLIFAWLNYRMSKK